MFVGSLVTAVSRPMTPQDLVMKYQTFDQNESKGDLDIERNDISPEVHTRLELIIVYAQSKIIHVTAYY